MESSFIVKDTTSCEVEAGATPAHHSHEHHRCGPSRVDNDFRVTETRVAAD